jgi:VIT1/CCC1 family predicted Fe2+/Mn2+ transporter
MAGGEYVSVSAQRDTEVAVVDKERWELKTMPERELAELAQLYEAKGLTPGLAHQVAVELHAHDALAAHAESELGLDPTQLANPWSAAITSAISFALGALLPLVAITLSPAAIRIAVTVLVVIVALVATGYVSARLGGAPKMPAVLRNVGVGVLAMLVTYGIGALVGTAI